LTARALSRDGRFRPAGAFAKSFRAKGFDRRRGEPLAPDAWRKACRIALREIDRNNPPTEIHYQVLGRNG